MQKIHDEQKIKIYLAKHRISKLKLLKNYFTGQEKLSNIPISSTETEISKEVGFENTIDGLASVKAKEVKLLCFNSVFSINKIFKLQMML